MSKNGPDGDSGYKILKMSHFGCIHLYGGGQLNLILDLVAAVSQLEQARVDQTAVVPGSYGPSPCPNVTALVHFGIAAFFFVAGSRESEFPRTLSYYLAGNCAWL